MTDSRRLLRRWWAWAAIVVILVGIGLNTPILNAGFSAWRPLGSDAELPTGFNPYIHRASGTRADPVNLIFRGASTEAVAQSVTRVLGWSDVPGSAMMFVRRDGQRISGRQFGLDLGGGTRLHLRVEAVGADEGQTFVLAAIHRDDWAGCGHVGGAFDEARDIVAQAFAAAGYHVTSVPLANTESGRHCDGSWTHGDGAATLIDLTPPG